MKKRMIWIGFIVILAAAIVYRVNSGSKAVVVDAAAVEKGNIDKYVEETAVVHLADETSIYTSEGGKVTEVLADEGKKVKKGNVLLRLDDSEILLEIKALESQRQNIEAQYAKAQEPANDEEIRRLSAQVRSAEVSYEEANRSVENNKVLYDQGAVSMDVYQSSLANLAKMESSLEEAKSDLELAQKGLSSNIKKQFQTQLNEIQAKIELLEKKKNDLTILSPSDGIILTNEIEKDSVLQPGKLPIEIGNQNSVFLESDILMDDVANIKIGSRVLITNEDLGIKNIAGTVRKIYPKAFSKTSELGIEQKRVKVEIGFNDSVKDLKSGYDMKVKIITASRSNTLLVDKKAIFEYQGKDHVFVNENSTARLRAIEKGIENDDMVEILNGLKEGEKVILSPDEKLKEGTKIK